MCIFSIIEWFSLPSRKITAVNRAITARKGAIHPCSLLGRIRICHHVLQTALALEALAVENRGSFGRPRPHPHYCTT